MVGFGKFHQRSQSRTSCQQLQEWPWMGPFGKVCKKCAAAQKQKNDENCQWLQGWYHRCQQLQGRGHSARCARNVLLIRSRRMTKTVNGYKDGTTVVNSWCAADQKQKNDENCQRLQGWYHRCQQLQGRGHSARCAINVLLIRSRGMMKTVNGYKDGTTVVNSCKDGAIRQGVQEMCCWSEAEEWRKLSTVTRMVPPLSTVARTGPFGKVCNKCAADQK